MIAARASIPVRPLTVAVTSGKGGVGKTSISASLGAALVAEGRRVLLLDADLGLANLDILLGLTPKRTIADLIDGRASIDEVLIEHSPGLWLLPAASGVSHIVELDDAKRASLLAALEHAERDFDVVIVDCAAGIGSDVQLFAGVADEILVIATPDPTSLTDAYALMKVLHTERRRDRFHVLAAQVDSETQARKVYGVLATVSDKYLGISVDLFGWLPSDDQWRRAVLERRIAFASNPDSPASKRVKELARRVVKVEAQAAERAGLSSLLLGELA